MIINCKKNNYNQDYIERNSVSKLENCLIKTQQVLPNIRVGDKDLSWDGYLQLFKSKNDTSKNNLEARIPIQVKGTCVLDYRKKTQTFQVDIDDLKNYYNDDGVMFFLIAMSDDYEKFSIYYKSLLPLDLYCMLKNKDNQKSVSISLKKFPYDDEMRIIVILNNFTYHQKKQIGRVEQGLKLGKLLHEGKTLEELNIECLNFSISENVYSELKESVELYVYAQDKNGFEIPTDHSSIDKISMQHEMIVNIGDKEILCNVQIINSVNNIRFVIENAITIYNGKINFKLKGKLDERIKALKIMLELSNNNILYLQGTTYCWKCSKINSSDILMMKKILKEYLDAKNALSILNYNKKLDLDQFNNKDFITLSCIINSVLNKKPCTITNICEYFPLHTVRLGNANLIVDYKSADNKKYNIVPIESTINSGFLQINENEETKHVPFSKYLFLKEDDFVKIDNIPYDSIYKSIIKSEYHEEILSDLINFCLNILSAYDKNDDPKLLELVTKITFWLKQNNNTDINIINYYQCKKRIGELNEQEKEILYELKDNTEEYDIKCAIDILLGNSDEAHFYLKKMTSKASTKFKQFPIYNLLKR